MPTHRLLAAAVATALSATTVACLTGSGASAATSARVSIDRHLQDRAIRESSGLARSTFERDVVWTHNDSGDSNRIFAVGRDGRTDAEIRVLGAGARDWEDMAAGPGNTLWIGDIGDNAEKRSSITVYRVNEPTALKDASVPSTGFELKYPDGAHDAEGIMVKPRSGRLFVVSKHPEGGHIYRAPRALSASRVNHLEKVAKAPSRVSSAAWRPGGGFVLANYSKAFVYRKLNGRAQVFTKPELKQGESVEFSRAGGALLLGSEGSNSPVYRMKIR